MTAFCLLTFVVGCERWVGMLGPLLCDLAMLEKGSGKLRVFLWFIQLDLQSMVLNGGPLISEEGALGVFKCV